MATDARRQYETKRYGAAASRGKVMVKVREFESIEQSPDCPRIHKTLAIPGDLHASLLTQYLRRHTST
jgi:hypothetical protein